jgi:hypothetical protein
MDAGCAVGKERPAGKQDFPRGFCVRGKLQRRWGRKVEAPDGRPRKRFTRAPERRLPAGRDDRLPVRRNDTAGDARPRNPSVGPGILPVQRRMATGVLAILLMSAASGFAASEPPPEARPLTPPLHIAPLAPLPNLASPPRPDTPGPESRVRPEGQGPHGGARELHRRERTRIFVWDPFWGGDPAYPPPTYWYYCQELGGYYPFIQQCPGGWMTVIPPVPPGG